jgi:hypothetical protein
MNPSPFFIMCLRLILILSFHIHPNLPSGLLRPPASHRGDPGSSTGQVMWDLWLTKWHWGRFSEYFGFPCQFSFHRLLHIHHHPKSGAGTIGQLVADVPSGLSLTPTQEATNTLSLPFMICDHNYLSHPWRMARQFHLPFRHVNNISIWLRIQIMAVIAR